LKSFRQLTLLLALSLLTGSLFQTSPIVKASDLNGPSEATLVPVAYLPVVQRNMNTLYWGALVQGNIPETAMFQPGGAYDQFETQVQKKMAIIHWGQSWQRNNSYQPFVPLYFNNVRNHGSIPMIDWGSQNVGSGATQPNFTLKAVYQGQHDTYIQQWATAAKTWGHPFFLRFDWEMDGYWQFPWAEQINTNQPGDYIKAWRHVHDIFTQVGASNVTWVWCPNIASPDTRPYASVYPGDAYVDWTCLDGYNKYPVWLDFHSVFGGYSTWLYDSYNQILAVAPNKPMMIGETASLEAGDGGAQKAAWWSDALAVQLQQNFPRIKALVLFNWDGLTPAYASLPVESTSASLNAFSNGIRASYFVSNNYANLNTSPIPPP
jgi:hypothetical protein